jgi:hypothetical protein
MCLVLGLKMFSRKLYELRYFGSDNWRGCKEHLICKLNTAIVKTSSVHIPTGLVTLSMITNFLPVWDLLPM